ncbi:MAG: cytidine/deoxycytidylate deaminase family protein [Desulfobacterales bacterium]|jgi:dCMP deaminase|nr:cytidine deaminase [Desulfobacter sp.]MDP6395184.1 cytidine/deoxycytidylate deaminase family protein [Desulfobacterales bacterium]MDP6683237.1 cytidine/deoxycytidylate deaminase family protein [Desulfobacterales bacterium]MDP6806342.1 cytidine/deoxycytidylate deaminase family protein [Desulfobacterales bacterium]|tara:strand:+ start:10972 stop:11448 length:477 start_codon:yes stop_codon:yes gene_type:complete
MPDEENRPSWEAYFMDIAALVAKRSTCLRRTVGAAAVKNKQILATGYNGVPTGIRHCIETGCLRQQMNVTSGERHELCRGIHAEQNVIIQAAFHGVSIKGASLFCTNLPCSICAKMIINAGIKKIYFKDGYADLMSTEMLSDAGIEVIRFNRNHRGRD